MECFYTPPHLITPTHLLIEGDEFSHLTHVMRKEVGDLVFVIDGVGTMYEAVISELRKDVARCTIRTHHFRVHEPERQVTLAVGVLKNGSRFDFLVEKTTEVGVHAIVPMFTERTIPRHAKTERWQKLALAAMKQSGRCVLPKVHPVTSFTEFIHATTPESLRLIAHEKVMTPMLRDTVGSHHSPIVLCIGPEGGFSDEEIDLAKQAGWIPAGLGERRLRTETAAIVAVAAVLL